MNFENINQFVSNIYWTSDVMVFILWSSSNHTTIKYRCPITKHYQKKTMATWKSTNFRTRWGFFFFFFKKLFYQHGLGTWHERTSIMSITMDLPFSFLGFVLSKSQTSWHGQTLSCLKDGGISTLRNVFGVTQYCLSCSLLIVNRMCSVTNTRCIPNIICHSLLSLKKKIGHRRFTLLQQLPLTKWIFIQLLAIHDNLSLRE